MKRNRLTDIEKEKILIKCSRRCYYCQLKLTVETMTLDHFLPLSSGGSNEFDNLVAACKICNSFKADREIKSKTDLKKFRQLAIEHRNTFQLQTKETQKSARDNYEIIIINDKTGDVYILDNFPKLKSLVLELWSVEKEKEVIAQLERVIAEKRKKYKELNNRLTEYFKTED